MQKKFTLKSDYDRHLNRKFPCKPPNDEQNNTNYDLIIERLNKLEKENREKDTKLEKLEKELDVLKNQQKITNIVNNDNSTIVHDNSTKIIISPVTFGEEDIKFITENSSEVRKILNHGNNSLLKTN